MTKDIFGVLNLTTMRIRLISKLTFWVHPEVEPLTEDEIIITIVDVPVLRDGYAMIDYLAGIKGDPK